MIRITSKRAGFRRCGMPHPKEPIDYPDDKFTEEELDILMAEPMLIVELMPNESEPEPEIEPESETEPELEKVIIKYKPDEEKIVIAAKMTIASGKVTKDGKPLVEEMEKILGRDITAAERDEAWQKIATD